MNKSQIKIGWAQTDITPTRPVIMEGQMYQRYSRYVHDSITATALAFDTGKDQAIFVSMDMAEVPVHAFSSLRVILEAEGISFDWISFNVTHTHNSSSFYHDCMRVENEQVYDPTILPEFDMPENMICGESGLKFFVERISRIIISAWENRIPGGISYAHDYAAVAFNRRPQFRKNNKAESIMYGDCSREDFIRFEGGIDTSVEFLYTWNEAQELTGIICNVPCPSQVYELHSFLSADYWAPARSAIREKLQRNVYILPVCGAAGDMAPIDLVQYSKTNKQVLLDWSGQSKEVFRNFDMTEICQSIGDRISEAVIRGYRKAKNYIDEMPVFAHEVLEMSLPIRQVSEDEYQRAKEEVREIHQQFTANHPMTMKDLVEAFEPQGVILRYRQQKKSGMFTFKCHILRIGNIAIATNPFELYQEYAQRIKARAQAEQVFIIQLSNDSGGYLPTNAAVKGGSYSSKPASTVCGPDGGDILVEKTLETLNRLWEE